MFIHVIKGQLFDPHLHILDLFGPPLRGLWRELSRERPSYLIHEASSSLILLLFNLGGGTIFSHVKVTVTASPQPQLSHSSTCSTLLQLRWAQGYAGKMRHFSQATAELSGTGENQASAWLVWEERRHVASSGCHKFHSRARKLRLFTPAYQEMLVCLICTLSRSFCFIKQMCCVCISLF